MVEQNSNALGGLYPWLLQPYRSLVSSFRQRRGPAAYLLYGSPDAGGAGLLAVFANWILCAAPNGEYPCGRCDSCNLVAARSHPDWLTLDGEKEKCLIGIEQVRGILPRVYGAVRQGGAKVVVVYSGEKLNEAASNSLLKTIEEPPNSTYFLLFCRYAEQLPATIRSRCQQWYLGLPEEQEAVSWLTAKAPAATPKQIASALELSCGAPLAALRILDGDLRLLLSNLLQQLEQALCHDDMLFLLTALDHSESLRSLSWLAILFWIAAKGKLLARAQSFGALPTTLGPRLGCHFSYAQLTLCLRLALECRNELAQLPQLNQRLLLTELLCKCQEVMFIGSPPLPPQL